MTDTERKIRDAIWWDSTGILNEAVEILESSGAAGVMELNTCLIMFQIERENMLDKLELQDDPAEQEAIFEGYRRHIVMITETLKRCAKRTRLADALLEENA